MKKLQGVTLVALATAVWAVFTWPLPRHFWRGIPHTARNPEPLAVRAMVPGDHLQLLYHFWLASDMLRGKTPWFHNLYEFNTGDDAERFRPDPYYAPFSLVYAAAAALGGQAFGWNLAGWAAWCLSVWLTWRLARRYAVHDGAAAAAALLATALPYRWHVLLGGSPAGYAMAFVPALFLGLDLAARDDRAAGGWLAGAAVICAFCTDLHVFFFSLLTAPCWCLFALTARPGFRWRAPRAYLGPLRALLPALLLALPAAAAGYAMRSGFYAGTDLAGGRTLREVLLFSAHPAGLLGRRTDGINAQVFLGWTLPVTVGLGWVGTLLWADRRRPGSIRRTWVLLALAAACAGIVALALGPRGPWQGRLFLACRRWIPAFSMIRQPARAFTFLPALMAVAGGVSLAVWLPRFSRRAQALLLSGVAIIGLFEFKTHIRAGISLLDREQPAYAAVAADAAAKGGPARALALPLWPGDSHWSSLYEHYAALYRIRMLNGYAPAVGRAYRENVFRRFEGANLGELPDDLLDDLLRRGIRYLVMHEGAFPEKVSPFPVGFTLQRLSGQKRLSFLAESRGVWAYRIEAVDAPESAILMNRPPPWPDAAVWFPARKWEAEQGSVADGPVVLDENTASAGRSVRLQGGRGLVRLRPTNLCEAPDMAFLVRARGVGLLALELTVNGLLWQRNTVRMNSDDWTWQPVALSPVKGAHWVEPSLTADDGVIRADAVLLTAGIWKPPAPGKTLELPAWLFFHAGRTDPATYEVELDPVRDPSGAVFYGLNLPLPAGRYRVAMTYRSEAPFETLLGIFTALGEATKAGETDVTSGTNEAGFHLTQANELPVRLEFRYSRRDAIRIRDVRITRMVAGSRQ